MHSERDVVKRVSAARAVPAIDGERTGVTMSESATIVELLFGKWMRKQSNRVGTSNRVAKRATWAVYATSRSSPFSTVIRQGGEILLYARRNASFTTGASSGWQ